MSSGFQKYTDDDETTYGADNSAFYMAQNRDGKGPVHIGAPVPVERPAKRRRNLCSCWLVGLRSETWINLAYNLFLNMIWGTFCWAFFTALTTLGCTLLPFCGLGIPVILGTLQLARNMATADIALLNMTVSKERQAYRPKDSALHENQTFRGWSRAMCCSCQSYSDFFFLWICKMPIAWFGFFVVVILSGSSIGLLVAPIVFWTCDICMKEGNLCLGNTPYHPDSQNGECHGWKIDHIGDALGLCFLGILVTIFTLHISNGVAHLSKELSRCALASDRSTDGGARTDLLADQHQPVVEKQEYCTSEHPVASTTPSTAPSASLIGDQTVVVLIDEKRQAK